MPNTSTGSTLTADLELRRASKGLRAATAGTLVCRLVLKGRFAVPHSFLDPLRVGAWP